MNTLSLTSNIYTRPMSTTLKINDTPQGGVWYTYDMNGLLTNITITNAYNHGIGVAYTNFAGYGYGKHTCSAESKTSMNGEWRRENGEISEFGAGGVGGLLAVSINGNYYLPCYDANGNITAYVNESGIPVASYTYDAFGNTLASEGLMKNEFSFRFSTKYLDTYLPTLNSQLSTYIITATASIRPPCPVGSIATPSKNKAV